MGRCSLLSLDYQLVGRWHFIRILTQWVLSGYGYSPLTLSWDGVPFVKKVGDPSADITAFTRSFLTRVSSPGLLCHKLLHAGGCCILLKSWNLGRRKIGSLPLSTLRRNSWFPWLRSYPTASPLWFNLGQIIGVMRASTKHAEPGFGINFHWSLRLIHSTLSCRHLHSAGLWWFWRLSQRIFLCRDA